MAAFTKQTDLRPTRGWPCWRAAEEGLTTRMHLPFFAQQDTAVSLSAITAIQYTYTYIYAYIYIYIYIHVYIYVCTYISPVSLGRIGCHLSRVRLPKFKMARGSSGGKGG